MAEMEGMKEDVAEIEGMRERPWQKWNVDERGSGRDG